MHTALLLFLILLPGSTLASEPLIVSDGDTFSINGEKIRPVGFDAPELARARCVSERIPCKTNGPRCLGGIVHDVYGRTLARVFAHGEDVGQIMIREGYAIKYRQRFRGKWCNRLAQ